MFIIWQQKFKRTVCCEAQTIFEYWSATKNNFDTKSPLRPISFCLFKFYVKYGFLSLLNFFVKENVGINCPRFIYNVNIMLNASVNGSGTISFVTY